MTPQIKKKKSLEDTLYFIHFMGCITAPGLDIKKFTTFNRIP
jgi:hypothetical protein